MAKGRFSRVGLLGLLGVCACATPAQSEYDAEVDRLCGMDGGVTVYEIVRLPLDRFDQHGNVRIRSKQQSSPQDEYYYERDHHHLRGSETENGIVLSRMEHRLVRRHDAKVLGKQVWYARGGGDLPGPWHPSSYICPPISAKQPSVERSVFLRGN